MKNYVQKKPFEIKSDDFMLIEGKYENLLISEVDDLNYLKRLKYKPWVINSNILSEILNYRIINFKNKINTHGLYFFFDEDKNLIYVGKSETNLINRMFASFEFRQENSTKFIKYVKFILPKTVSDTCLLEQYFIKKHNPILNLEFKNFDELTITITGIENIIQSELIEIRYDKLNSHMVNNHVIEAYKLIQH